MTEIVAATCQESAAQVVGTYASSQCFAKAIAIFWSYDKKDYSICDRVSAFRGKKQHILSWAVVSVLHQSSLIDLGRVTFLLLSN